MKKLLSRVNIAEVGLLQSILEAEGIACAIRNEQIAMASGGVPFTDCYPELWVLNDDDFGKAEELLAGWENQSGRQFDPWTCASCGAENEGQFGACWQCGSLIDESLNDEPVQP